MERSTIHYLYQKGWTKTEIGEFLGHHRDTVARVLREPLDKQVAPRQRVSAVTVFSSLIQSWLDQQCTVQRMLEQARHHPVHPYTGSAAAFYDFVRPLKRARKGSPTQVPVRFEGLPGKLLQIDWGEVRQFPFSQPSLIGQTRYFFAARLKYSRFMSVQFTADMREETLLRCLVGVFVKLGGVPWVVTTDNMKTVTIGRDADHSPIWHPAFAKWAAEFGFLANACTPAAANQKGAVENLVKFVKHNFLVARTFHDDAHLTQECCAWLEHVNVERRSDATECPPAQLLPDEQTRFGSLPPFAQDYGFFDTVKVSRESLVALATNRYSVPVHLVGLVLTARIHQTCITRYHGDVLVATHPRSHGRNARVVVPEHYEAVFALKPRARVMAYRDWLVQLSPVAASYVSEVCRKRYAEMETQMLSLYQLAYGAGERPFQAALERASDQQTFGAEYIEALLKEPVLNHSPCLPVPLTHLPLALQVEQQAVERALVDYEQYVANRTAVVGGNQ